MRTYGAKNADHELKRDEIQNVAARCFAAQSFPAASMNDIAAILSQSVASTKQTRALAEDLKTQAERLAEGHEVPEEERALLAHLKT